MNPIQLRLIFEKDYQNKLKVKYSEALNKIYKDDIRGHKYAMNSIAFLIPICDGKYIISLDKKHIETEFYFGESDIGQGPSPEENAKIVDNVRKNLADYFINRNIRETDSMIETLEKIIEGKSSRKPLHYRNYWNSPKDSIIHEFCLSEIWGGSPVSCETFDLDIEDVKIILYGYKMFREFQLNKLNSYLKRYGTSKLHTRTYWIDR